MMATTTIATEGRPVATVPVQGWAPVALTARGTAAARLSDFADVWSELGQADRRWFAEWLTELLVDACSEPTTA